MEIINIASNVLYDSIRVSSARSGRVREDCAEVSPCLTPAFETIDKARAENSLAKYVTHLPRTINLSGERRVTASRKEESTYDEIGHGQTNVVNVLCLSLRVIEKYVEKSMPRGRARINSLSFSLTRTRTHMRNLRK